MDHRSIFRANGQPTVSIGIIKQSKANTLETLEQVGSEIDKINEAIPDHMRVSKGSDDSVFIRAAINSVYRTIAITTVLVSLVILVFLGSVRTMAIPAVTIPVCLVSAFIALAAFGFTVNLITLLALVLSIGLVVDDAIVVLENIHRRIEEGEAPLVAAYNGTRQVGFAVIATTAVVVAVFTPIMFLTDNIGVIFGELAVTIAAAVVFSTVLALSLTPVMCSKFLRASGRENRLSRWIDGGFSRLRKGYIGVLRVLIRQRWIAVLAAAGTLAGAWFLFDAVPREYVPEEDQGAFMAMFSGPEGMGIERMKREALKLELPARQMIDEGLAQVVVMAVPGWGGNSSNSGVIMVVMKPWGGARDHHQGRRGTCERGVAEHPRRAGVRVRAFGPVTHGRRPARSVRARRSRLRDPRRVARPHLRTVARVSGSSASRQRPQGDPAPGRGANRQEPRGRAWRLGPEHRQDALDDDERTAHHDLRQGRRGVRRHPPGRDDQRATAEDLSNIYVRSDSTGELVPLANLIRVDEQAAPGSLNRYNRLRAVTITAGLAPGTVLGEALDFLERVVRESFPDQARIDYQGESLEYKETSGSLAFTFGLALLIVFLVLAAQFESFVHPLVILVTVPLAVAGALLGLYLTGMSINIFSQIGIVMLIGIAAKNGVLIVEFINQMRDAGRSFEEAIIEASGIRLRPVVMTTISTIMGSIPLILATGAGAESRMVLGIVVFSGVSLATFLTLFIVPSFYALLARRTGSPQSVSRRLASYLGGASQ